MTGEDALVFLGFARFLMNERVDVQKVTAEDLWMIDRRSTFPKITKIFDRPSLLLMRERLDIHFSRFKDETQLEEIIALISNDLSEPYSIYVYRYFIQQW